MRLGKIQRIDGLNAIHLVLRDLGSGLRWLFSGVYSPCDYADKRLLWDDIQRVWDLEPNIEWVLGGDFNDTSLAEREGCRGNPRARRGFNEFITRLGLINLPLVAKRFTW